MARADAMIHDRHWRRLAWVALAVGCRPSLWPTAASKLRANLRPRWWRRWPPIPEADPDWLGFRLECETGGSDGELRPDYVVAWLKWCRSLARAAR